MDHGPLVLAGQRLTPRHRSRRRPDLPGRCLPGTRTAHRARRVSMLSWPRGIVAAIALMVLFLAINLFGVKNAQRMQSVVTWWKIIIPTATFLLLFLTFDGSNFTSHGFFGSASGGGPGSMFEAVAVSGIAFALMGFRGVIDFGGEVRRPGRNIPLGTVGCVVIPLAIYLGLQIAFLGAIDWADAGVSAGDWTALAGSSWADARSPRRCTRPDMPCSAPSSPSCSSTPSSPPAQPGTSTSATVRGWATGSPSTASSPA
ncbi:APC family permease [Rhodococcus opacus]|nr:APC family permease [Rhodococcus opacus]